MQENFTIGDIRKALESQTQSAMQLFAARAILRMIPECAAYLDFTKDASIKPTVSETTLILFSTSATALALGKWSSFGKKHLITTLQGIDKFAETQYKAYASLAMSDEFAIRKISSGGFRITQQAVTAIEAVLHYSVEGVASYVTHYASDDAYWTAETDIRSLTSNDSKIDLLVEPLWNNQGINYEYKKLWLDLKTFLLSLNEDWEVWTDWYEARLRGEPLIEEIEIGDPENGKYGRCTFPPEQYENPAKLNAQLKQVIEEYWAAQLPQDVSAETFDVTDDYKIVSTTQTSGLELDVNDGQLSWYSELREAVSEALTQGENALGAAYKPLHQLRDALPENMEDGRVPRLWRRANKLRRVLDRHQKVPVIEEFDPNRLSQDAADSLEDIVESYNNFRVGDTGLMTADQNAPSPQDTEDILASNALIDPLITDVIDQGIAEGDAVLVLTDMVKDTSEIDIQNDIMGRMSAEQGLKDRKNLVRALLKTLRDRRDSFSGNVAAGMLGSVIISGATGLIGFVALHFPTLLNWFKAILAGLV